MGLSARASRLLQKIVLLQKVMLHYGKKKSILKFYNFWLSEFHNGSGTNK